MGMWRMECSRVIPTGVGWTVNAAAYHNKITHPNNDSSYDMGSEVVGCNVVVNCDNETVVTLLGSRYSREPHLMHMLFVAEAHYQFKLSAQHIPGTRNTLADHLSRNQLHEFYKKSPLASRHPSHVPFSLLQWLLYKHMDWTSDRWTQLFTTFVNKA